MGVDAHANSKYLNWFLDSCLSWNWTISCALFAIEKLTLGLFSIILGLKIWSCNCLQLFCGWKFGLAIVFKDWDLQPRLTPATGNFVASISPTEKVYGCFQIPKVHLWFSGFLVLWFSGSSWFYKTAFKEKNLFWLVGAVKYYFANLSINECSISKRYITLHINGWQQPVESVRDLGGRLVVGWSGSRTDQRQPEAATVSYSKASHGERCKTGSWRFFWDVTFLSCSFFKSNRT